MPVCGSASMATSSEPRVLQLWIGETQAFPATGGRPAGNYYGEYRIGGTSLASPLFAAMIALADQASGRTLGFANPIRALVRPAQARVLTFCAPWCMC